MKEVVLAAYKPHEGKEKDLEALIKSHNEVLRDLDLITDRKALTIRAMDGTYVEIIEWKNANAASAAHDNPKVAEIWESMAKVADFTELNTLEEAQKPFCHFKTVDF